MPATPIADVTDDGVAELALVENLSWQAGAKVLIYDAFNNRLVKEIVLEETALPINRIGVGIPVCL